MELADIHALDLRICRVLIRLLAFHAKYLNKEKWNILGNIKIHQHILFGELRQGFSSILRKLSTPLLKKFTLKQMYEKEPLSMFQYDVFLVAKETLGN